MAVEPEDSELPEVGMSVSLSPEVDPPDSPATAVKTELAVDDHPMEVDEGLSDFQINDLVEINGAKRDAINGKRGLIIGFDDLGHSPTIILVATITLYPKPSRQGSAGVY